MALLKKFAGETVIYGLGSVLPRVLIFSLTPYLTSVFGTGEYGTQGVMFAFAAFLMVFFTYGMETTLFRFGSEVGQKDKVFSTAAISLLVTSVIFVSVLFFFSQEVANFLNEPEGAKFVKWFALISAFDALAALFFARLRLESRAVRFAVIKILNVLINISLLIFFLEGCPYLIKNGYSFFSKIYTGDNRLDLFFSANVMASAAVFLILFKDFFKYKWQFDVALWQRMLRYASPLILVGLAGVINRQLDRIFLKKWLLVDVDNLVGIYNANVKLAVLMSLFITAFNYAAEPFFFKNATREDSKQVYAQIAQAFSVVGSLAFLGIMLYLDIFKYLIDDAYWEGLQVVPFLLLAYFGLGLFYNFSIWYKLKDQTRIGAWISIGGAVVTVLINYIFIPTEEIMAPAYAALTCYTLMALASYFIGKKYYPIDYPIGKMLSYIILAIGIYYLSTVIRPNFVNDFWKIMGVNTLLLILYLGVLTVMERSLLSSFFKK
ncbi:MAG: oligosaccharide flippase family protein [Bacteroidota bacterium]